MKLSDLLEERARIAKAMRALNDQADKDGNLTADQQAKFDGMKEDLAAVENRIQRQQTIDELDRRAQGQTLRESGADELSREKRKFSIIKLMASAFDAGVDAKREIEICQEQRRLTGKKGEGHLVPFDCFAPSQQMERRVLTASGTGQYLISETVLGDQFIDALRPMAVSTALGARVLTGLVGDVFLPKRDSRTPAAAWFTENATIGSDDQAFTQVPGRPHHLGLITEFSRKMLLQSTPGIEELTRTHLMQELAVGLDLGVMKGTGMGGQPYGIVNTAGGIQEVDQESGDPTWAGLLSVIAAVEGADVPPQSLGWALNAWTKAKLRGTTKVADDAAGGFLMDDAGRLGGLPVGVTSQLVGTVGTSPATDGEAIFGAWSEVIVAMWSGVEILVNPFESTAYSKGNVSVRGIVDADVLVRHAEAFCHWKNIKVDPSA